VNAARYGLEDLMKKHSKVYETYVNILRPNKPNAVATQPPRSSSPHPNPAESLSEKWRKEEAAKEAWQRKQDRAREAALNQAKQRKTETASERRDPFYHEQPWQRTSPSPRQGQRQKQTSRPSASQEPKDQGEAQKSSGKDWSEANAGQRKKHCSDRPRIPREEVYQQPKASTATPFEVYKDSLKRRLVVIHGLRMGTSEKHIYDALLEVRPGAVAQLKLLGTSAWIEFYWAGEASKLQMLISTQKLRVYEKLISDATVEISPLEFPPLLTSRVLRIVHPDYSITKEDVRDLMFHLRQHGVDSPMETRLESKSLIGEVLRVEYASWRGQAETAKAVIECTRHRLLVRYLPDPCATPSPVETGTAAFKDALAGNRPELLRAWLIRHGLIAVKWWVAIYLATMLWSSLNPKEKESPSQNL
ncbi:hypothetical protein N0V82_008410, partial [Gnomoniopsis sp. IMI 355080]